MTFSTMWNEDTLVENYANISSVFKFKRSVLFLIKTMIQQAHVLPLDSHHSTHYNDRH